MSTLREYAAHLSDKSGNVSLVAHSALLSKVKPYAISFRDIAQDPDKPKAVLVPGLHILTGDGCSPKYSRLIRRESALFATANDLPIICGSDSVIPPTPWWVNLLKRPATLAFRRSGSEARFFVVWQDIKRYICVATVCSPSHRVTSLEIGSVFSPTSDIEPLDPANVYAMGVAVAPQALGLLG
jgi:hypothetical protein